MKKLLVCSFAFCCLVSSLFSNELDKKLHEKCIYPTVKLEIESQQGGGSGVIIRSEKKNDKFINVVLTAFHVLTKGPVVVCVPKFKDWSTVTGYDRFECVVFSASQKHDLAIIIFESSVVMPVAELDFETKPYIGTKIFKLGFGVGDECRLDRGEITSVSTAEPAGFTGHLRFNAHTIFGDSGGPLFLENNYKVYGINKAIRGFQQQFLTNFAYASPMSWLKIWNTESNDTLAFVYDSTKIIPMNMAEIKKRNALLNLKSKIETIKKDIQTKTSEIASQKQVEEALKKEIKRIEENSPPTS